MSKGGLAFLNKKSWHTGKISNYEKVWQAEEKAKAEAKKLEELRKEIDDERQKEQLRELQKQAGLIPDRPERMGWMDYGSSALQQKMAAQEEFLLGKEFKVGDLDSQALKKDKKESVSGTKDWVKKTENRDRDVLAKIRDDPLLVMMYQEKKARDEILSNPMYLKKLKKEKIKRNAESSSSSMEARGVLRNEYGVAVTSSHTTREDRGRRSRDRSSSRSRYQRKRSRSIERVGSRKRMRSRRDSRSPSRKSHSRYRSPSVSPLRSHREYESRRRHRSRSRERRRDLDEDLSYGRNRAASRSPDLSSRTNDLDREARLQKMIEDARVHSAKQKQEIEEHARQTAREKEEYAQRDASPSHQAKFIK